MELSREAFRSMIYYDFRVGLSDKDCHERLCLVFGDEAPSYMSVFRWYKEFQRGRTSLHDEHREGRPRTAVTPENVATVKVMIEADNRYTYSEIEKTLGIEASAVYNILHNKLQMKKVVSRWVPHTLTDEQKQE